MKKKLLLLSITVCCGCITFGQGAYVDSLMNWINTHPDIDSQHIQTLHRISYRLSEKDVNKS
ncbi:MAG: hypothetical protein ABIO82_01875, partial [Ginsengibacter sp.]